MHVVTAPIPSLQSLIDIGLQARADYEGDRPVAGGERWRASKIGTCLREQYLAAKGIPARVVPDAVSRRNFFIGDETADALLKVFWHLGVLIEPKTPRAKELSLSDPELHLGANVDAIVGGRVQPVPEDLPPEKQDYLAHIRAALVAAVGEELGVTGVEIKTVKKGSWDWSVRQRRTIAQERHFLQTACYAILAERRGIKVDRWVVLSCNKENLLMTEEGITNAHRDEVFHRLAVLNYAYDNGLPPYCNCFDPENFGGKGWAYCPYYSGSRDSRMSAKKVPDAGCCEI